MSGVTRLSLRVPAEVRDRLQRAAAGRGVSMSALAVAFLGDGLERGGIPGDGPLVLAVAAGLDEDGTATGVEREIAVSLARTAQAGGTAGVSAVRELRAVLAEVLGLDEDDPDLMNLHVPE